MARIFITGSADGLGQKAAATLTSEGHKVVLHARNPERADHARAQLPGAAGVVTGDLATLAGMRSVAEQVNRLDPFDAVIHNASVGYLEQHIETADGVPHVFAINVLAPYVLTALIRKPSRLVYVGSGMHQEMAPNLDDLTWKRRKWDGTTAYSESKLHVVLLAFAVARAWPTVLSNAMEPGWVPTKMGGTDAPDSFEDGTRTQIWLAADNQPAAKVSGKYFYHLERRDPNPAATNRSVQDQFMAECARLSGVPFPA